jgi:hypothetical protein
MFKTIGTGIDRAVEGYSRLPKWLRFALHYGLIPLWVPAALLVLIPLFIISQAVAALLETWREFK